MATIQATDSKTKQTASGNKEYGEDLDGAVKLYGKEIVYSLYAAQFVVRAQSVIRGAIKAKADVQKALDSWTPGVKRVKAPADPNVEARQAWANMSEAERKAFLKDVQQQNKA